MTLSTIALSIALVALGGFGGGLGRWGLLRVLPDRPAIFAANLAACTLAGVAFGISQEAAFAAQSWQARTVLALSVGVAGGLSTWSTLAKHCGELLRERQWKTLAIYLGFTLAVGVVAAGRGVRWGHFIAG